MEKALRQLMQGLTSIAAQLEKAAGELRRYIVSSASAKPRGSRKAKAARKPAAKKATKKKAAAKKTNGKPAGTKAAAKKSR